MTNGIDNLEQIAVIITKLRNARTDLHMEWDRLYEDQDQLQNLEDSIKGRETDIEALKDEIESLEGELIELAGDGIGEPDRGVDWGESSL